MTEVIGMDKVREVQDDHEKRITQLEFNYSTLEKSMYRVENTVVAEGREQRALLNKLIENQFKLDNKKLTSKEKVMLALVSVVGGAVSGGGILYLVVEHVLK